MVHETYYKAHRMYFFPHQVFGLLKVFDKMLDPIFGCHFYRNAVFEIDSEDVIVIRSNDDHKDYYLGEDHYWKILWKLEFILIDLEKFSPIKIVLKPNHMNLGEKKFEEAFPNIFHLIHDMEYLKSRLPRDDDGTKDLGSLPVTISGFYVFYERLIEIGVYPR